MKLRSVVNRCRLHPSSVTVQNIDFEILPTRYFFTGNTTANHLGALIFPIIRYRQYFFATRTATRGADKFHHKRQNE